MMIVISHSSPSDMMLTWLGLDTLKRTSALVVSAYILGTMVASSTNGFPVPP